MTLLYRDGPRLTDPKDVLALLAVFAGEGSKEENYWPQTVSDPVKEALRWLQGIAKTAAATEAAAGAVGPYGYWELNTTWVDPVSRWLQGDALASIATDYDIYEGNLIRILSKMANLLEEWRTLAALSTDTATLQCMADAEQMLLTGIATSDSLYLRL
jgi:superfamily II RNA helicase